MSTPICDIFFNFNLEAMRPVDFKANILKYQLSLLQLKRDCWRWLELDIQFVLEMESKLVLKKSIKIASIIELSHLDTAQF